MKQQGQAQIQALVRKIQSLREYKLQKRALRSMSKGLSLRYAFKTQKSMKFFY